MTSASRSQFWRILANPAEPKWQVSALGTPGRTEPNCFARAINARWNDKLSRLHSRTVEHREKVEPVDRLKHCIVRHD